VTLLKISAVSFFNTLKMSDNKIKKMIFTALTPIPFLSVERGLSTLE
jgi:hypothetical protein